VGYSLPDGDHSDADGNEESQHHGVLDGRWAIFVAQEICWF
jgi:hypothetical protein